MRKILVYFLKGISFFLILILLYFIIAVVGSIIPVNNSTEEEDDLLYEIFIESNGVHTDIIFPLQSPLTDWPTWLDPDHTISENTGYKFIAFGWGDLDFYRNTPEWSDLTPKIAFKSLFLKTPAAMHVKYKNYIIEDEHIISIQLTEFQYVELANFIKASFDLKNNAPRQIPDLHYSEHDAFYHAHGSLNLFYTCNTWTNNGLKSAEIKTGLWTPFVEGIFYHH